MEQILNPFMHDMKNLITSPFLMRLWPIAYQLTTTL